MVDKNAVITGGEGSMAIAIRFLISTCVGLFPLAPTKQFLDVTNEEIVKSYMERFKPSVLINCAGYIIPNSIKDTSLEEWKKHFDINITGAFLCSKYAIIEGCKTVINIGSTSAFGGRKEWGAYSASKAALLSLTETLVEEGINAYTLNPARTVSEMRKRLFPDEDAKTLMDPMKVAKYVERILEGHYKPGSHLILSKDCLYVLPGRTCPKC